MLITHKILVTMILIYFNNYFLFKAWKNKKILRVLIITQLEPKTTFTDPLEQLSPRRLTNGKCGNRRSLQLNVLHPTKERPRCLLLLRKMSQWRTALCAHLEALSSPYCIDSLKKDSSMEVPHSWKIKRRTNINLIPNGNFAL